MTNTCRVTYTHIVNDIASPLRPLASFTCPDALDRAKTVARRASKDPQVVAFVETLTEGGAWGDKIAYVCGRPRDIYHGHMRREPITHPANRYA